jgi:hypothetical protein
MAFDSSGGMMAKKNLTPIQGVVSIQVSYNSSQYQIKEITLLPDQIPHLKGIPSSVSIGRMMACFKVTDLAGVPVNVFSSAIDIHIEYTANQWDQGLKNNKDKRYKHPRIAYLAKLNNLWAGKWVEFKKSDIKSFTAPAQGSNGVLVLSIKSIPDPLIGGC